MKETKKDALEDLVDDGPPLLGPGRMWVVLGGEHHFLLCASQFPEKFTYVASLEIILCPLHSLFTSDPGLSLFLEEFGNSSGI